MKVTEYNVGRWCLSEDECIAAGISFAAYERGVADAAKAFGKNRGPSPPLLTEGDWQAVVDDPHVRLAFISGALKDAIEERISLRLATGSVPA